MHSLEFIATCSDLNTAFLPIFRCWFDVVGFIRNLNLKLVGISGFRSDTDAWSRRQTYTALGANKAVACRDVDGFSDPCPTTPVCTGVASLPSLGFAAVIFSVLSLLFSF